MSVPLLALGFAAVAILIPVVWSLAFRLGQEDTEKKLAPHLTEDSARSSSATPGQTLPAGSGTLGPVTGGIDSPGTGSQGPQIPESTISGIPGDDPRQTGLNYLQLCTLTFRDADAAAQYLGRNGVRAILVPVRKGIDTAAARDKNELFRVFVADGVPSERFKATEKEREELVSKVERIGKRWQREERGPSDFSRPGWVKFQGKD